MQIVKLGEKLNGPVVVCLGFFGCMHAGHAELVKRAKLRARMTNAKVALFTFSNNHLQVLKRDSTVVYTFEERLSIYKSLGIDYVITATFDDEFKKLTGKQFLSQFERYDLQGVVCGYDHCCGKDHLDAMGIRKFFKDPPVYIVEEQVCVSGEKISTSLIKQLLSYNQIERVNNLLSEPFFVIGKVVKGKGIGRTLGFPTANISYPAEKLLPSGVYGGVTVIDGVSYRLIVKIGQSPTFDVSSTCEALIIGFDGDLYGKTIKISLTKFLRSVYKFNSSEKLAMQLQLDKECVLND